MTVKSKFKPGEIVYYKYPSRYTRSKDEKTIEVIVKIHNVFKDPHGHNSTNYFYKVNILKVIRSMSGHWSSVDFDSYEKFGQELGINSLDLETYSRRLTPAESVLYG